MIPTSVRFSGPSPSVAEYWSERAVRMGARRGTGVRGVLDGPPRHGRYPPAVPDMLCPGSVSDRFSGFLRSHTRPRCFSRAATNSSSPYGRLPKVHSRMASG